MKKYVFIVGFVIGVAAIAYYFYDLLYLFSGKEIRFRAVPLHAAFFVDIQGLDTIRSRCASLGMESLTAQLKLLEKASEAKDVLQQINEEHNLFIKDMMSGNFLVSYHVTRPGHTEALLIVELAEASKSDLTDMLKAQSKYTYEKRIVRSEPVWDISIGSAYNRWTITVYKDLLLMSKDPALVEDGLLQLKDNVSVYNDKTFQPLASSSLPHVHLYYHFSNISSAAQAFADKSGYYLIQPISRFADWMALSLNLNTNGLTIQGKCTVNSKELRWLNDYSLNNKINYYPLSQKPDNTALLMSTLLKKSESKDAINTNPVLRLPDFEQYVAPWFDEEASLVLTEPVGDQYDTYSLLFLKTKPNSRAFETLKPLMASVDDANNRLPISYKGYLIGKLNTAGWYSMLVSNPFADFLSPYVLVTNDYVILANSLTQLKLYLERLNDKKTLDKSIVPGLNMAASSTATFTLFAQLPLLNDLFENITNKEFASSFLADYNRITRWSPLFLEWNYDSKGAFNISGALITKLSTDQKKNTTYLWKTELDTIAQSELYVVLDGKGREKRLLVQDANNTLYMLNRAGDVVWRRILDAPVVGNMFNIDFYKNNEYQIVLATENKIYVMDDAGKDLPNFPITIPFRVTTGLNVIDPESSRNYLYFVGCENGYYYGYEKSGRPLSGWNPNPNGRNIAMPVSYFRFRGKEFFMLITQMGDLKFYSRYGMEVYKDIKTHASLSRPFVAVVNKGFVVSDAAGNTYLLGYDGKLNKKPSPIPDCIDAMYANFTSPEIPDLICLTEKNMSVYRFDSTFLFRYDFKSTLTDAQLQLVRGPGLRNCIVVRDHDIIFPINTNGVLAKHFPKKGIGQFVGADLYNNGEEVLIGLQDEKTVVAYPLEW
jgi:hypothetical protein